jgi:hypothetical protein
VRGRLLAARSCADAPSDSTCGATPPLPSCTCAAINPLPRCTCCTQGTQQPADRHRLMQRCVDCSRPADALRLVHLLGADVSGAADRTTAVTPLIYAVRQRNLIVCSRPLSLWLPFPPPTSPPPSSTSFAPHPRCGRGYGALCVCSMWLVV